MGTKPWGRQDVRLGFLLRTLQRSSAFLRKKKEKEEKIPGCTCQELVLPLAALLRCVPGLFQHLSAPHLLRPPAL